MLIYIMLGVDKLENVLHYHVLARQVVTLVLKNVYYQIDSPLQ